MALTDTERLAWIAGFFDGEGCISIHFTSQDKVSTVLRASMCQNDSTPLETIRDLFGGSLCATNKKAKQLSINGKKAVDFLVAILPYLVVKRAQAEVALMYVDATLDQRVEIRNRLQTMKKETT